jgi:hypothetical protein
MDEQNSIYEVDTVTTVYSKSRYCNYSNLKGLLNTTGCFLHEDFHMIHPQFIDDELESRIRIFKRWFYTIFYYYRTPTRHKVPKKKRFLDRYHIY